MQITIGATTIPNYQAGGSVASLRIYTNDSFFGGGMEYVAGQGYFYQEIACTVAANVVTIPSFVLESTTDSNNDTATYTAVLFDHNGTKVTTLMSGAEFSVPPVTPTSWTALMIYNQAVVRKMTDDYYTANQVQALLNNPDIVPDATTSVKGKVKLDTTPASPAVPVVVGANSPKINRNELFLPDYASFSAAITAIGSTPAILNVDTAVTHSASNTIPANVAIKFKTGGSFSVASGQTVSILGEVIAPRNQQIFSGAGNVSFTGVLPETLYPEWWGAKGDGVTDDIAAFDAMIAAIPGNKSAHIKLASGKNYIFSRPWEIDAVVEVEGQGADNWNTTTKISVASNQEGIILHHTATKTGVDTGRYALFSRLKNFALVGSAGGSTHTVDMSGLTLTKTAGTDFADTSGYHDGNTVTINNFTYVLSGVPADTTHINVRKPRIYAFTYVGRPYLYIGDYNTWPTTGDWVGQNVSFNGTTYTISSVDFGLYLGSNRYRITLTAPYLGSNQATEAVTTFTSANVTTGTDTITATGHNMITGDAMQFVAGGTLPTPLVAATTYYAIAVDANNFKVATSYANAIANTAIDLTAQGTGTTTVNLLKFGGTGEVQSLAVKTGQAARFNLFHGIDVRAAAEITNMKVWSFAGNGISMDSALTPGVSGTTPNSNNTRLDRNSLYFNYGNGIYTKGINSNQCFIDNNDSTQNHGAGIYEASFLGNNYFGNHTSFNYFAATYGTGATNVSQFFGEYSEGGQPSVKLDQYMLMYGGNPGAGFDSASTGGYINQSKAVTHIDNLQAQTTASSTKVGSVRLGVGDQQNAILGFGAAEESANLFSGGSATDVRVFSYQLGYDQLATGWYDLYQGGSYADHSRALLGFSGSTATEGAGKLWLPAGAYFGRSPARRNWQYVNTIPTSGTVSLGDIFWNNNFAAATDPIGWVVTTAGTIGSGAVLTPFGALPDQTGNSGKVLSTNGTAASWTTPASGMAIGNPVTSATQGSVLFAGASGVLAQNNSDFFWDDTNKRIKIFGSDATGQMQLGQRAAGLGGIWLAQASPSSSNWSVSGDASTLVLKAGSTTGGSSLITLSNNQVAIGYSSSVRTNVGLLTEVGGSPTFVPQAIRLAASQTADAWQITDNSNNVLSRVNASGYFTGKQASGSNVAGGSIVVAGGESTGTANGGTVNIKVSNSGASGSSVNSLIDRQVIGAKKALTSGSATGLVDIALPTLTATGGVLKVTIVAINATDIQQRTQVVQFGGVNKAGTYTTNATVISENASLSTGTLTGAWTVVNGTNKVTLTLNATSSITPTTLYVTYSIENNSEQAITIL